MGFSDDGITQQDLDRYYAQQGKYGDLGVYAQGEYGGLETEAPWELARATALADFIAAHGQPHQRVLDVGCSTGTLLALLQKRGFSDVAGVEPLPQAVLTAREGRGLDVYEGWIGTAVEHGEYDVVTFSHVLEHVLDLREVLGQARDLLSDDGLLVVEVPDASRFRDFIHIPYQDFNTEHINHFSSVMLNAAISSAGFELIEGEDDIAGSGPNHAYPVTRGIWRKTSQVQPLPTSEHDRHAHRHALQDYCVASEELFAEIDRATLDLVGDEPFAIWGAGQFTMKWIRRPEFPTHGLRLLVDEAPSRIGLTIGRHTVVDPSLIPTNGWPPLILTGSAYAADSITAAIRERELPIKVATPFPSGPTVRVRSSQ